MREVCCAARMQPNDSGEVKYLLALYARSAPVDERRQRAVLDVLLDSDLAFSPLSLQLSRSRTVSIERSSAYARAAVPDVYEIDHETARIPLSASNGCEIVITESLCTDIHPANVQLEIPRGTLEREWSFRQTFSLFRSLVEAVGFDYAFLSDERRFAKGASPHDVAIQKVPRQVYWLNYYGKSWLANIGRRAVSAIQENASVCSRTYDGLVFAVAEYPMRDDVADHVLALQEFEDSIGLREVHRRYPNHGV